MSKPEVMDADYEVISMVNKCHKYGPGPGGELPTFEVPAHNTTAEAVSAEPSTDIPPEESTALDERIQNLQNAMPQILCGAILLFTFIAVAAM